VGGGFRELLCGKWPRLSRTPAGCTDVHTLLAGAAYVATLIAVDGTSVLVHCR